MISWLLATRRHWEGETYTIVTAGVIEGTFDTLELQDGLEGELDYADSEFTLTVTGFVPVSVEDSQSEFPGAFALHRNYPNMFNPTTTIRLDLPQPSWVRLIVYDVLGQHIETLLSGSHSAGSYSVM